MPTSEIVTNENTTRSATVRRMFLGFSLHAWEQWMLVFLGVVAIGGVGVVAATYAVIKLQREESAQAKKELDEYKASAAAETAAANEKAATANERAEVARREAAEAQLALERFKAPRTLSASQQDAIAEKLRPFAGQKFDVGINSGDPEAISLAEIIENILAKAGWEQIDWKGGDVVYSRPERRQLGMISMAGVFIQIEQDKAQEFEAPAVMLAGSLNLEGIASKAEAGQVRTADNKDVIHVMVGRKP
jgi:hypothetical protein